VLYSPWTQNKEGDAMKDLVKLSLRDYFAASAMQGLLASGWCSDMRDGYSREIGERAVVTDAYRMADEMLLQREREKVQP
jgi:hypothetical protein